MLSPLSMNRDRTRKSMKEEIRQKETAKRERAAASLAKRHSEMERKRLEDEQRTAMAVFGSRQDDDPPSILDAIYDALTWQEYSITRSHAPEEKTRRLDTTTSKKEKQQPKQEVTGNNDENICPSQMDRSFREPKNS